MINARKERHGAIQVADPDLAGAGVEIEGAFFVDLGWGVRRRNNLDADLWCALEKRELRDILFALRSEPGDIGGFDACGGGDRALGHGTAGRAKLAQQSADMYLAFAVERSWRRTHEDVTVLVGLDAVRELCEFGIGQDPGPASEVEAGLGLEIRELDRDRHSVKIRQKWKKA